ncbi:PTS sugar transporter subunit IIA [[Clostridium] innocuum]|uniref:PTS sugar transporter subunit IIA n=1 Tax=Clostridium innocuum TaxID=1522 RepID=UPI001EDE734C|nr:PTS sugar transporter subunit IIA [[Clostridium] innocuum]MCG4660748.1 PTS sugar transporter subunit IIA [[Clostridium] innocuum]
MFFDERIALFNVEASSSEEVIKIAADELYKRGIVKENFYEHVMLREKELPTGLATDKYGVAIPHTDSKYVNRSQIEFISLKSPVKFKNMGNVSEDVEVTHVFMIAMSKPHEQSEILVKLMEMFADEELMQKMHECSSDSEYESILKEKGLI